MTVNIQMPRYQCHKKVWALKIKSIDMHAVLVDNEVCVMLHFEDDRYAPIAVPWKWIGEKEVTPGGYYVVYEDGYKSFSPAAAFELGYTRL